MPELVSEDPYVAQYAAQYAAASQPVAWWERALEALSAHPEFTELVALSRSRGEALLAAGDLMRSIVRAVSGQQVSNAAALKLSSRVLAAAGGARGQILAEKLAALGPERLRAQGLSRTKAQALNDLALRFAAGEINEAALANLSDHEVALRLTAVRGVGPWTAHMILIFGLGRPDVWPLGDYGLRKALQQAGISEGPHEEYAPWRTAATWLLWRSLTQSPVQY